MARSRIGSWLLGVAVLVLLASRSTYAIGPAFVVVHGRTLDNPIVLRPSIGSLMFLWTAGNFYEHIRSEDMTIPSGLEGRRYLEYDVYWGRFTPQELKPEAASQHGRIYLPAAGQAAVLVITPPAMTSDDPSATRAPARPIPHDLGGFASGRALSTIEAAALIAAGVPLK